jgi:hypothetical protein
MKTLGLFFRHAILLFVHPLRTLRGVDRDDRRAAYGLLGAFFLALTYAAVLAIAHFTRPGYLPAESGLVLRIPADRYYFWEIFLVLPAGLGGAILAAGAVRLSALLFRGRGSFERLFALLAFGYVLVAVVMGFPDLVLDFWPQAPLFHIHVFLGSAGYFVLSLLAVKEVEALSWPKTLVLTLVGAACHAAVQFVFIR